MRIPVGAKGEGGARSAGGKPRTESRRGRRWKVQRAEGAGQPIRPSSRAQPSPPPPPPPRCCRTLGSNREAAEIRTCAQMCARALAQARLSRWLVKARGASSRAPPRPEVRALGRGGLIKGPVALQRFQSSCVAFRLKLEMFGF